MRTKFCVLFFVPLPLEDYSVVIAGPVTRTRVTRLACGRASLVRRWENAARPPRARGARVRAGGAREALLFLLGHRDASPTATSNHGSAPSIALLPLLWSRCNSNSQHCVRYLRSVLLETLLHRKSPGEQVGVLQGKAAHGGRRCGRSCCSLLRGALERCARPSPREEVW